MRWYARPEGDGHLLRVSPRLASWEKVDHPDQVRLRAYLDDTEALLADSRIDGPWALRLDVGLLSGRDLLDMADLDNYAYPLACRVRDLNQVSVWCTKQHNEQSFVRIEPAREVPPPSTEAQVAKTTASATTLAYKEQIYAAVAGAAQLPAGPVKLELSFVVGPRRNWLNLWKQTIDSLDPLLGRTDPDRAWHPLDGRITELGMHLTVDPAARNEVVVGIAATQAPLEIQHSRHILRTAARANAWHVRIDDAPHASDTYLLPGDPSKGIKVYWAASCGVLMAAGGNGSEHSHIWRGDDMSTKTERVLSALASRTGEFPPAPQNDAARVESYDPRCSRCFTVHTGECLIDDTVDPENRNEIVVDIAAAQPQDAAIEYIDMLDRVRIDQPGTRDHRRVATVVGLGPGEGVTLEIGRLSFGMPASKLAVIDKRIPEGAVITRLIAHDGPCRDSEGALGRCDIIVAEGYMTPDDHELRSFQCRQRCEPRAP
jgi:hypothetical protein